MHLADHIRPLLRDHDCVIIPDFGGLVADFSPARVQPSRHTLSPPSKQVAFNQALTRNDGLLVDALAQYLHVPAAQAREVLRAAVAQLQHDLAATNRTELPGIGIFRRAEGRGLSFEYTGTEALLPAAYGLPELAARPVRAAVRPTGRTQRLLPVPQLRTTPSVRRRVLGGAAVGLVAGLVVAANYLFALNAGYLPAAWQARLPRWDWAAIRPASPEPQQAGLARQPWAPSAPVVVASETSPATLPVAAPAPAPVAAAPAVAAPAKAVVVAAAPKPAVVVAAPVAAKALAAKETAAAPAYTTTINGPTGRYYIVAASFKTLAAAQVQRQTLAKFGHRARIILPRFNGHKIKVSIDDYADKPTAEREAQRMRTQTHLGKDLWILPN